MDGNISEIISNDCSSGLDLAFSNIKDVRVPYVLIAEDNAQEMNTLKQLLTTKLGVSLENIDFCYDGLEAFEKIKENFDKYDKYLKNQNANPDVLLQL